MGSEGARVTAGWRGASGLGERKRNCATSVSQTISPERWVSQKEEGRTGVRCGRFVVGGCSAAAGEGGGRCEEAVTWRRRRGCKGPRWNPDRTMCKPRLPREEELRVQLA